MSLWGGDVCPASVPRRHRSRSRAYQLRAGITPYDAVSVALATEFDCSVLTPDARLAHAPGPQCPLRWVVSAVQEGPGRVSTASRRVSRSRHSALKRPRKPRSQGCATGCATGRG